MNEKERFAVLASTDKFTITQLCHQRGQFSPIAISIRLASFWMDERDLSRTTYDLAGRTFSMLDAMDEESTMPTAIPEEGESKSARQATPTRITKSPTPMTAPDVW